MAVTDLVHQLNGGDFLLYLAPWCVNVLINRGLVQFLQHDADAKRPASKQYYSMLKLLNMFFSALFAATGF